MPSRDVIWPNSKARLCEIGLVRVRRFCEVNNLPVPQVTVVSKEDWFVHACAFYRPDIPIQRKYRLPKHGPDINICLEHCGSPAGHEVSRNWTWPGSVIDREPYGVLCHELGHHVDWLTGSKKWEYGSEFCEWVKDETGEPGLTNYANENPAEWFAESFRLFVTNASLLKLLRPRTFSLLRERWQPVSREDWLAELGVNVPKRVVQSIHNKVPPCPRSNSSVTSGARAVDHLFVPEQ